MRHRHSSARCWHAPVRHRGGSVLRRLVADAENGKPLTDDGFARLVVPGDIKGGRYVSNVNLVAFNPPRQGPIFPFWFFGDD
jgi:hypothetical protein